MQYTTENCNELSRYTIFKTFSRGVIFIASTVKQVARWRLPDAWWLCTAILRGIMQSIFKFLQKLSDRTLNATLTCKVGDVGDVFYYHIDVSVRAKLISD